MSEQFARAVLKVAIAQIFQNVGFHGMQHSACEALTEILSKYIEEIGRTSHMCAELACRTECNYNDVKLALSDIGLLMSDLSIYAKENEDNPLNKAIPRFPVRKKRETQLEFREEPEEPLPDHIPPFLPPFPDKHAFKETPAFEQQVSDPRQIRKMKSKQNRQVESSLTKLSTKFSNNLISNYDTVRTNEQQQLQKSTSSITTSAVTGGTTDNSVNKNGEQSNPFLSVKKVSESERQHVNMDQIMVDVSTSSTNGSNSSFIPTPANQMKPVYVSSTEFPTHNIPVVNLGVFPVDVGSNSAGEIVLEDEEVAKKRQKVEKILSLQYADSSTPTNESMLEEDTEANGNPSTSTNGTVPVS